jgi:tRNA-modifying protein YgfZ
MPTLSAEFETQYKALTGGVGLVDFSDRTQIEVTGADRAGFLHNLCSNAVRDLQPGQGCEAFLLNVKGHVVGHVLIFVSPNSIVLETAPDQAEKLLAHLERYLIREDVQLHDRSQQWGELLLAGAHVDVLFADRGWPMPEERLAHTAAQLAEQSAWLRRVDLVGPGGYLVACSREALDDILRLLLTAGAVRCGSEACETARIEQGTPWYGRDITEENLPQEIDRSQQAISFTKGCYLGQETVARIDALGHVNRLLRGVKFSGEKIPSAGSELMGGGKPAGHVTSACWSPALEAPLALALVRRECHEPGTKLESAIGPAEVVALPSAGGKPSA